ncbi:MAG: peptide chain release factor N(5)-glutamine methyltransferase, partial [Clostridia bacterium]|nr:peptide chain release factor N(5)-glutamine methyltransferase [Clostridia bacterium]
MTAKELYKAILARLEAEHVEDAGFDGLQLFAHHTGMDIAKLLADPDREIPQETEKALWESVDKRCGGEPLQYILGSWEFYSLPFLVGPGVLIPRADTEVLVDEALRLLEDVENPKVADLCTG